MCKWVFVCRWCLCGCLCVGGVGVREWVFVCGWCWCVCVGVGMWAVLVCEWGLCVRGCLCVGGVGV